MGTLRLAYGSSHFSLNFDASRFHVIAPEESEPEPAHERLVDSAPLEDVARGKRVLVIVSDLTRPTGAREFLPGLLRSLEGASVVRFLFATGLHRPLDDRDKAAIVGDEILSAYPMLDHEPESGNTYVGDTSFGNRVEIDSQVLEHDLIVLTGAIGFHYFAGFSGGRKSLLPGVASRASIEFNHLLVLNRSAPGRNPDVRVASMEGNPVHQDMVEGAQLVDRELFVYNTILDSRGRISRAYCGDWQQAHRLGADDYMSHGSVQIPELRNFAVVSCGGFPRDINMIQAHKALEFARYAVRPGGTIILLAECREGAGHPTFFPWFRYTDLAEFERELRSGYQVYGQTAYSLLSKTRQFRIICVSALPEDDIRKMGMEPAPDLDAAMTLLDAMVAGSPGYVLPFGGQVLPVPAG